MDRPKKLRNKNDNLYMVGVDVGGTFTDFVVVRNDQVITTGKTLTTPQKPTKAVIDGMQRLAREQEINLADVGRLVHATTLITNAIIERKGARTGLITSKGFKDILTIGRERRYDLYQISPERPIPLIPSHLRREVPERILYDGSVWLELDEEAAKKAAQELVDAGINSLAICFLHAHVNPKHEARAKEIIQTQYPHLYVSVSSDVAREIKEYERFSTTAANAYVLPLVDQYLGELQEAFNGVNINLMLSNGGVSSIENVRRYPIKMLESGPAAGALVASFYGNLIKEENVIAFDMGGTTAKVCLVISGKLLTTYGFEAARVARFKKGSGFPIQIPTVELIEIGAGGGSIARIDNLGLLKVGPHSAGADPGPACYGYGGEDPTVTDADLVLGYLNPDYFLGGEMRLNSERAREALAKVAGKLKKSMIEAAWGIHDIVNENMAMATRIHIAEKGQDPRKFMIVATGGAAGMHIYRVAKKIGMSKILCPLSAGVASAFGLLVAPPRVDLVQPFNKLMDQADFGEIKSIFQGLERQARGILSQTGLKLEKVDISHFIDLRYKGQGYEVPAKIDPAWLNNNDVASILGCFEAVYLDLFGRKIDNVPVEIICLRLFAEGTPPSISAAKAKPCISSQNPLKGTRQAFFPEAKGFMETKVFDRYKLAGGFEATGPAIIEERETTIVVGPEARFHIDNFSNLRIEINRQN